MSLFGKPKGWDKLSAEDQAWFRKVNSSNRLDKMLHCIQNKQLTRIAWGEKDLSQAEYRTAALAAVDTRDAAVIKALMTVRGFNFRSTTAHVLNELLFIPNDEKDFARSLFAKASHGSAWDALYFINTRFLSDSDVRDQVPTATSSPEVIAFHLKRADGTLFGRFLDISCRDHTENIGLVLSFRKKFRGIQEFIDENLLRACQKNAYETAAALIAGGADPSCCRCEPFKVCIRGDNREIFDLLLSGISLSVHGGSIVEEIRKDQPQAPLLQHLEEIMRKEAAAKETAGAVAGIAMIDPHAIAETRELPGGVSLTTVFNFNSCQQIFITRFNDGKTASTTTIKGFDAVDNPEYIEEMRQKLIALGGKAESSVYVLPKSGLLTRRAP